MLEFLKPFWLAIVKWAAIAGAIALVLFKVRQSGKEAEQHKAMRETLKEVRVRDRIEENIGNADDAKLKRLHDKWTRG